MAIFVVMILVLVFRLWSMQIVHGQEYTDKAAINRLREATTIAPRGRILDRNGIELVTNRTSMVVLAPISALEDDALIERLATHLMITEEDVRERIGSVKDAPLDLRVVGIDVPMDTISYIAENQALFPDIQVAARAVRTYPQAALASQVLGYAGLISEADMERELFENYHSGDIVGKSGAELAFETVLQGVRGRQLIEVDAQGKPQAVVQDDPPQAGQDVMLTLDAELQGATEQILAQTVAAGIESGLKTAGAAAVVLDVKTGEVLAMASYPTYDPEVFVGGITQKDWEKLTDEKLNYPLINRAIGASYPPASTFKAFVGLGALDASIVTTQTQTTCVGGWTKLGQWDQKNCWIYPGSHGTMDMHSAVAQSCNYYFYDIGYAFEENTDEGLQKYLESWGYGSVLGIDLPGEVSGRIPTAEWKNEWNVLNPEFNIGAWVPGDGVHLAIGQGDVLTTPLQLASTYAGIAYKGKVLRPHVLKAVLDSNGDAALTIEPEVVFEPSVTPENLAWMREYLRAVVTEGTAYGGFSGFGTAISGKTGTAEYTGTKKDDTAWFVGFAPSEDPQFCVAVVVEQGGAGGRTATPATRSIFGAIFHESTTFSLGTDRSR
ncbi:MAG: penicillin-binding protein 2 [Coriobacteriia bacterium]|nr:penicillin-binding protein 2 [Coriobacteriia bacterium]